MNRAEVQSGAVGNRDAANRHIGQRPSATVRQAEQFHLPLSWSRREIAAPRWQQIHLPLSGLQWISLAELPANLSFPQFYEAVLQEISGGFLLRGCNEALTRFLVGEGCESLLIGREALLCLQRDVFEGGSLRALVRRGSRWGRVEELPSCRTTAGLLADFQRKARHGTEPQLRHLFRHPADAQRSFALVDRRGGWLGAVTLSEAGNFTAHAETFLRHPGAPVGVMEYLFSKVFARLRDDGYRFWSLGEVPFVAEPGSAKERWMQRAGHMLGFAYHYRGLHAFKKKFSPQWRPLYLCARPRIPLRALVDLFVQSGYCRLALHQLRKKGQRLLPFGRMAPASPLPSCWLPPTAAGTEDSGLFYPTNHDNREDYLCSPKPISLRTVTG